MKAKKKTIKQSYKSVQVLKIGKEALKKTQIQGILKLKYFVE